MYNQFIWVSGEHSAHILEHFSKKNSYVYVNDRQHLLIAWKDTDDKSQLSFSVKKKAEACSLMLGQAEVLNSNGGSDKLTPENIWSYLENKKTARNLSGRFTALRYNDGVMTMASDVNGSVSSYWAIIEGRFVVTSDFWFLVSLLPDTERKIDMESLYEATALSHFVGESTMLTNIKRIEPGHVLAWDDQSGRQTSEPYYIWSYSLEGASENKAQQGIEDALLANIQSMLEGDENPALLLSGGVDSGTVFGMMNRLKGQNPTPYTVKFAGSKYDETQSAKKIADKYSANLEMIQVNYTDMFDGAIKSLEHSSDPAFNQNMNLEYVVQELIGRNGHRTIWDGDFADALFGPLSINNLTALKRMKILPAKLVEAALKIAKGLGITQVGLYQEMWKRFGHLSLKQYIQQNGFHSKYTPSSLGMELLYKGYSRELFCKKIRDQDLLDKFMIASFYLADRVFNAKNEVFEKATGLSPRKPFIRTAVIHEAEKLPHHYRVRPGIEKYLLKKVAENYLPNEIVYATKITYDSVPHGKYITEDKRWYEYVESMFSGGAQVFNYFDESVLKNKIGKPRDGHGFDTFLVWRMVTLEFWFQKFARQKHISL